MFHQFTQHDMGVEDFTRTYGGCVIRVEHPKLQDTKLMYIDRARTKETPEGKSKVVEGSIIQEIQGRTRGGTRVTWNPTQLEAREFSFNYEWPDLGLINVRGSCIYLSRRAVSNSYKRGFYPRNVMSESVNEQELNLIGQENPARENFLTRPYFVNEIYNPGYYKPLTALKLIRSGRRLAAAISPTLFVASYWWTNSPVLGYKQIPIGEFNQDNSVSLYTGNEFFQQQVGGYFSIY